MNSLVAKLSWALPLLLLLQCNSKKVAPKSGLFKIDTKKLDIECQQKGGRACTSIGRQFNFGTYGRTKNYETAANFYRKACDSDDPYGCKELGMLRQQGLGINPDSKKARALFTKACEGKVAIACQYLADFNVYGKAGLQVNLKEASLLYSKACDLGSKWSCKKVGREFKVEKRLKSR